MSHPSFADSMLRRAAVLTLMLAATGACHRHPPLDTPPGGYRPPLPKEPPYVVTAEALLALTGTPGILPSVAVLEGPPREWGDLPPLQYTINGFRADDYGCVDADNHASVPNTETLCPIHPYFLIRGDNRIQTAQDGFKLAITRWDYLQSRSNTQLADLGPARDATFKIDLEIPEWPWVHGRLIADSPEMQESLHREVEKFYRELAGLQDGGSPEKFAASVLTSTAAYVKASELRGKPYEFVGELIAAVRGEPIGVRPSHSMHLRELASRRHVELFAGGTIARVVTDDDGPIIAFDSNMSDGPWGGPGGTVMSCNLWYRQDEANNWILDAIVPERSRRMYRSSEADAISEDNLSALFGASVF